MRYLLLLLLCVIGCATPIRVVETYVTDSATGKTTKVIQRFYDSTRSERWDYYQDDYVNLMINPYMYYDPFFFDPFWGSRRLYYTPRVVVPINPPRGPRVRPNTPRYDNPRPGVGNPPKPGVGTAPIRKYEVPRPLPPGPRGSYTPQPRSFSPPSAPRPVERGSSPSRQFSNPIIKY
jgi:hypothetical protein